MVAFAALSDADADRQTVLGMPLWAMLGQFEPADVKEWGGLLAQDCLWMYVMVSNVLLVNLLSTPRWSLNPRQQSALRNIVLLTPPAAASGQSL